MARHMSMGAQILRIRLNVLILILLLALTLQISSFANASEQKDFCRPDKVTKQIFVDVTSKFDERSKTQFQAGLRKIVSKLLGGERLIVSTIENTFTANSVIYDSCVPHCQGASFLSSCTEGFLRLEKKKQMSAFSQALFSKLTTTKNLLNSDITRTVYFGTLPQQALSDNLVLYIFSDLIENSDFIDGKEFFSSSNSRLIKKIVKNDLFPNFTGSKVFVFGIGRGGSEGRTTLKPHLLSKVRSFWKDYFNQAGAKYVQISESYAGE